MKRRTKASLSGNFRRILDKIRRACKAMRANKIATFDPLIRAISMEGGEGTGCKFRAVLSRNSCDRSQILLRLLS